MDTIVVILGMILNPYNANALDVQKMTSSPVDPQEYTQGHYVVINERWGYVINTRETFQESFAVIYNGEVVAFGGFHDESFLYLADYRGSLSPAYNKTLYNCYKSGDLIGIDQSGTVYRIN